LASPVGAADRRPRGGGLALGYALYLARGSQMLEFVVPLVPFLAMNIGLLLGALLSRLPKLVGPLPALALIGVFTLNPTWGYVLVIVQFGKIVPRPVQARPE
jgi:hypothetical protein